METRNTTIPEKLKSFVQRQVERWGYSSVSEYLCDLIRADQEQQAAASGGFMKDWDNPRDAIYDEWQAHYRVREG